jgi:hypothetical protein
MATTRFNLEETKLRFDFEVFIKSILCTPSLDFSHATLPNKKPSLPLAGFTNPLEPFSDKNRRDILVLNEFEPLPYRVVRPVSLPRKGENDTPAKGSADKDSTSSSTNLEGVGANVAGPRSMFKNSGADSASWWRGLLSQRANERLTAVGVTRVEAQRLLQLTNRFV